MNVPAIALKTFHGLKNHSLTMELVQLILKKLSKMHDGVKRARFIHRLVDEASEEAFSNPVIQQLSPCKQGCTGCCHTQVSVTDDEAKLLALRVAEGVSIDVAKLQIQMTVRDNSTDFYAIPYEQRRCVFLSDQGSCRIYEDRPSVCRTNAVIGDAAQCDTSEKIRPTRLVKTPNADLVIYASFLSSRSSGSLSYMLAKALKLINQ